MISFRTIVFTSLYFVACIFPLQSCNHRAILQANAATTVTKIFYTSTGGRSGNYESLAIAADSVVYLQAQRGVEKTTTEKTAPVLWAQLLKTINLEDFDKIKSNPGHALYDGIDVTLSIESGAKTYTVVNGNEDSANFQKIAPFTNLLEKSLAELRPKIIW